VLPHRPRLLFVVTLAEIGGAQTYVRQLLPAALTEYDVTVAAHGEGPLRETAAELGVPFVPLEHVRRNLSPVHDPLALLELIRLYRRLKPDVVHLNSSKAGLLGRVAAVVARVPVCVFTAHGWAFNATGGRTAAVYRIADRLAASLATCIVCVCEADRRAGLAAKTCREDATVVIPNAIDVGTAPAREPHRAAPIVIAGVGRLAQQKDFATLVAAVARLPRGSAALRIYGDGPLRPALEQQIAALGLAEEVELAGEVPDVRRYLEAADVFALTSRWEGLPLSALEAMAASLPVVASRVDGLPEAVVDGETGYLTEPGDVDAVASALGSLADDEQLRRRLGDAGRARVEQHFSLPGWRAAHLDLYRRLRGAPAASEA
jgi:glycosyltransferase involved in cell wall biosynthesis